MKKKTTTENLLKAEFKTFTNLDFATENKHFIRRDLQKAPKIAIREAYLANFLSLFNSWKFIQLFFCYFELRNFQIYFF